MSIKKFEPITKTYESTPLKNWPRFAIGDETHINGIAFKVSRVYKRSMTLTMLDGQIYPKKDEWVL